MIGCSTQNKSLIDQRDKWHYKNWRQDFKDRTFCLCLLEGYQNKDLQRKIVQMDRSYTNALYSTFFDSIIYQNLKVELKQMKMDSIYRIEHVSEGGQGKKVFNHCLKYYKSKKLDSITKLESKNWKKIKNIEEIISIKHPVH